MNNNLLPLLLLIVFFGNNTNLHAQKKPSVFEQIIKKVEDKIIPPKPAVKKEITKKPTTKTKSPSLSKGKTKPLNRASAEEYGWIEIPVVFHFVHKTKRDGDITDQIIKKTIEELNQSVNNVNNTSIDFLYRKHIGSPKIKFYLPNKDESCNNLDPINWYSTQKEYFTTKQPIFHVGLTQYDYSLKKNGLKNSKKFLNIWVCELQTDNLNSSISINENNWPVVNRNTAFGYSTSPKEINSRNEGIVININLFNDLFLSNNNLRKETNVFNLAHEIGHYFGLYHPWSRVNNCNEADGDKVFDTPLTQNKNNFPEVNNNIIQTVCPPSTVRSNYQNFMDYSYHTGMFTKGQVARMRDQIKKYRPELLQQNSCPENAIGTTSGQQSTNPPNTQNQSGYADVCIKNKTRFKRRVVLTHRKSNYKKELLIALSMPPNPKTACTYDIPAGVYRCQVYTTITGSLIEDFEVRLNIGDNTPITITANGN